MLPSTYRYNQEILFVHISYWRVAQAQLFLTVQNWNLMKTPTMKWFSVYVATGITNTADTILTTWRCPNKHLMYTNSTNTCVFFDPIHPHTHRLTGSPVWFKDIQCEDTNASHILRCQTTPASGGERHSTNVCGSSKQRLLIKCGESYSTHPALPLTPQSLYPVGQSYKQFAKWKVLLCMLTMHTLIMVKN